MEGGDGDLKVEAIRGGIRNLKIDDAAAMNGGLKMEAVAIGREGDRSEGGDTLKRKPWEVEGEILKMKKDVLTAMRLWLRARSPEGMSMKDAEEKAQQMLGPRRKKTKVVKTKFSKEFIDSMAAFSWTVCRDLSEEELAQGTPFMRQVYAAVKIYEAKNREYWDTLAAQQKEMGYAEDEIEVTDDEEEEVVVKN